MGHFVKGVQTQTMGNAILPTWMRRLLMGRSRNWPRFPLRRWWIRHRCRCHFALNMFLSAPFLPTAEGFIFIPGGRDKFRGEITIISILVLVYTKDQGIVPLLPPLGPLEQLAILIESSAHACSRSASSSPETLKPLKYKTVSIVDQLEDPTTSPIQVYNRGASFKVDVHQLT